VSVRLSVIICESFFVALVTGKSNIQVHITNQQKNAAK